MIQDHYPQIKRINSSEEVDTLKKVAADDGHLVVSATHLMTRNGEIIGYASLGGMPTMFMWAHTKKCLPRDSAMALTVCENLMANAGVKTVLLPCEMTSPFFPLIGKFGYASLGATTLNWKGL